MRTVLDGGGVIQDSTGVAVGHWHHPDDLGRGCDRCDFDDCHWCLIGVPITDPVLPEDVQEDDVFTIKTVPLMADKSDARVS